MKDGYLEKNPFEYADLGIKPTKGKRVYLEIEEISLLKKLKIRKNKSLGKGRTQKRQKIRRIYISMNITLTKKIIKSRSKDIIIKLDKTLVRPKLRIQTSIRKQYN